MVSTNERVSACIWLWCPLLKVPLHISDYGVHWSKCHCTYLIMVSTDESAIARRWLWCSLMKITLHVFDYFVHSWKYHCTYLIMMSTDESAIARIWLWCLVMNVLLYLIMMSLMKLPSHVADNVFTDESAIELFDYGVHSWNCHSISDDNVHSFDNAVALIWRGCPLMTVSFADSFQVSKEHE